MTNKDVEILNSFCFVFGDDGPEVTADILLTKVHQEKATSIVVEHSSAICLLVFENCCRQN